jgi:hypothetical protein
MADIRRIFGELSYSKPISTYAGTPDFTKPAAKLDKDLESLNKAASVIDTIPESNIDSLYAKEYNTAASALPGIYADNIAKGKGNITDNKIAYTTELNALERDLKNPTSQAYRTNQNAERQRDHLSALAKDKNIPQLGAFAKDYFKYSSVVHHDARGGSATGQQYDGELPSEYVDKDKVINTLASNYKPNSIDITTVSPDEAKNYLIVDQDKNLGISIKEADRFIANSYLGNTKLQDDIKQQAKIEEFEHLIRTEGLTPYEAIEAIDNDQEAIDRINERITTDTENFREAALDKIAYAQTKTVDKALPSSQLYTRSQDAKENINHNVTTVEGIRDSKNPNVGKDVTPSKSAYQASTSGGALFAPNEKGETDFRLGYITKPNKKGQIWLMPDPKSPDGRGYFINPELAKEGVLPSDKEINSWIKPNIKGNLRRTRINQVKEAFKNYYAKQGYADQISEYVAPMVSKSLKGTGFSLKTLDGTLPNGLVNLNEITDGDGIDNRALKEEVDNQKEAFVKTFINQEFPDLKEEDKKKKEKEYLNYTSGNIFKGFFDYLGNNDKDFTLPETDKEEYTKQIKAIETLSKLTISSQDAKKIKENYESTKHYQQVVIGNSALTGNKAIDNDIKSIVVTSLNNKEGSEDIFNRAGTAISIDGDLLKTAKDSKEAFKTKYGDNYTITWDTGENDVKFLKQHIGDSPYGFKVHGKIQKFDNNGKKEGTPQDIKVTFPRSTIKLPSNIDSAYINSEESKLNELMFKWISNGNRGVIKNMSGFILDIASPFARINDEKLRPTKIYPDVKENGKEVVYRLYKDDENFVTVDHEQLTHLLKVDKAKQAAAQNTESKTSEKNKK